MLHGGKRGYPLHSPMMKIRPVPLHRRDAHGQDVSSVVTGLHVGQIYHGANQEAGAYQQRESQRSLDHSDSSQKASFPASSAAFSSGVLEHVDGVEPGCAEGWKKTGEKRR